MPDTLIGVAWPSVRETFALAQGQVAWIFLGSGCSYFVSSFFAGRVLRLVDIGVLLAASSALVALSGFNYGLATVWPWFVLGALLHGLGSGAIDTGLNHYVAIHFSARHMNWLHAAYSLGAMLGPVTMTACITLAGDWRLAYLIVASAVGALALLFYASRWRWTDPAPAESAGRPPARPDPPTPAAGSAMSALRHRTVQLGVVLFFIYTGLEVAIGQWSFTILTESRGMSAATAGAWVTVYWGGILVGRVVFGFLVERIGIDRLIRGSLVVATFGTALFAWNPLAGSAPVALAFCGLGLAVVFPCLMTRTPQRVGAALAGHAIGFQIGAAMLGAAALPSVCGVVAQYGGLGMVAPTLLLFAGALWLPYELLATGPAGGSGTARPPPPP